MLIYSILENSRLSWQTLEDTFTDQFFFRQILSNDSSIYFLKNIVIIFRYLRSETSSSPNPKQYLKLRGY
jgi:hypothetical protein